MCLLSLQKGQAARTPKQNPHLILVYIKCHPMIQPEEGGTGQIQTTWLP